MDSLENILKDLKLFVENFGLQATILNQKNNNNDEKSQLKKKIENKIRQIKKKEICCGGQKLNRIKDLKILSCQEDYNLFDKLIKIIQGNNIMEDANTDNYCNNTDKDSRFQEEILVNKQLIKQKISEEYTNDMLGRAISKAENFSFRFGKKQGEKQFNYYNRFDNGFVKDKNKLLKSLMNALDTLQDYYEMDGDKKKFPSNFNQMQIISYINGLKNNCYEEDHGIFNDFITIIKGGHVNFESNFNSNCNVDPNVLAQSGVGSIKFASRQEGEWKEKAMKYGNYPCNLQFNQNWESNQHIPPSMNYPNSFK